MAGRVSIGSGTNYPTPVLTSGTYTYYASANTCTNSVVRTPVTVTVHALPTILIASSNSLVLCAGQTATLYAAGLTTYTWSSGGNNSYTSVNPTITTSYTVTGADGYGCVNSAVISQSVDICVGIKQVEVCSNQFAVFPNPSNSENVNISLNLNNDSDVSISLINNLGQEISTSVLTNQPKGVHTEKLETTNLPKGLYTVKIQADKAVVCKKLLIQ